MPGPTPTATPAFSPAEMDRVARERGYRDYKHMIFVMQNGLPRPKTAAEKQGTSRIGNFLRSLWNDPSAALAEAFAWHPANTIQRASDALNNAQER